jgi:hypothetical protein
MRSIPDVGSKDYVLRAIGCESGGTERIYYVGGIFLQITPCSTMYCHLPTHPVSGFPSQQQRRRAGPSPVRTEPTCRNLYLT